MPKNKKGGKGFKRGKKFGGEERELLQPEGEQQFYARITKKLGDGRFQLVCFDGLERIGKVRGKLRKRVWMNEGDYVLATSRDLENEFTGTKSEFGITSKKADIFHKYTDDEVRKFKKGPQTFGFYEPKLENENGERLESDLINNEDDCVFEFEDI